MYFFGLELNQEPPVYMSDALTNWYIDYWGIDVLGIHLKMVQIPYLSYFLIVTSMIDGEILIYALVKFNYTFNQVLLQNIAPKQ